MQNLLIKSSSKKPTKVPIKSASKIKFFEENTKKVMVDICTRIGSKV